MKIIVKYWVGAILMTGLHLHDTQAQTIDEQRMRRDIEVAENVLATLIKHEIGQHRRFFGMDVKGSYLPGYGVTFRLPSNSAMPFVISIGEGNMNGATVISDGMGYRYSITTTNGAEEQRNADEQTMRLKDKAQEKREVSADSVRSAYNDAIIRAAQNFILDYGDFISQLGSKEKIVVTNQGDRPNLFFPGKRVRISVEGTRGDITAFREGKASREQTLKKLTVVNTEAMDVREQDMELLSSIFSRLYRPDLSKTYFIEGNVYYERLKDYGAVFYMQMLSSEQNLNRYRLPTLGLEDVDEETRNRKVTELYPAFEEDVKENILEYGRTIKSLKDGEQLVFNISLTKCPGCGIPATLELTIPAGALREYGAGKITKDQAMNRFGIKRGAGQ